MTIENTLSERGVRYGEFPEHAQISQDLKKIVARCDNWEIMRADMREAIEMTLHKIARIMNGDPYYKDSWVDIEGYVRLVSKTLED